jgi:hypothetical protein
MGHVSFFELIQDKIIFLFKSAALIVHSGWFIEAFHQLIKLLFAHFSSITNRSWFLSVNSLALMHKRS